MNTKSITVATLVSIVTPAIAITVYFLSIVLIAAFTGSSNGAEYKILLITFIYGLLISGFHVIVLGLPIVWVLNKLDKLKAWTLVISGFVAGCLPMSIWTWPIDYSYKSGYSYWNGKETVIAKANGVPTLIGWVDYLQGVAFMGVFGIIAAVSFWWAWKRNSTNKSFKPTPKNGAV
jgi:hypothetical protein